jgi:methionyl-tRNA formyltransferase
MMADPNTATGLAVIVMGTGPFILPSFAALLASRHRLVAVVTRPDRSARGRRPPPNPMRQAAEAAGLTVLAPPDVNAEEVRQQLAALQPDLLVVCDYGQILSAATLGVAALGGINLHGSLLPRHRGAAPVQWAILSGDTTTGVSTIHMTPALDAGNVITSRQTAIGPRETAAELEPRLAELGVEAVLEAINLLETTRRQTPAGQPVSCGVPQDETLATRAPRLAKQDGLADWSQTAEELDRRRRALEPWPRLTALLPQSDGSHRRLVLADTAVAPPATEPEPPGTVVATDADGFSVACGGSSRLAVRQVVPEGRRLMTAADFLRGSPIRLGSRLAAGNDTADKSR